MTANALKKTDVVPQFRLRQALEEYKYRERRPFYWIAAQVGMVQSRLSPWQCSGSARRKRAFE